MTRNGGDIKDPERWMERPQWSLVVMTRNGFRKLLNAVLFFPPQWSLVVMTRNGDLSYCLVSSLPSRNGAWS